MIIAIAEKTKEMEKEMRELLKDEIKILKDGQKNPDLSEYYSYEALKKLFTFTLKKVLKIKIYSQLYYLQTNTVKRDYL